MFLTTPVAFDVDQQQLMKKLAFYDEVYWTTRKKGPPLDDGKHLWLKHSIFQEDLSVVQGSKAIFPIFLGNHPLLQQSLFMDKILQLEAVFFFRRGAIILNSLFFLVAIPQKPTIFLVGFESESLGNEIHTATTFFEPRFHRCFFEIQWLSSLHLLLRQDLNKPLDECGWERRFLVKSKTI